MFGICFLLIHEQIDGSMDRWMDLWTAEWIELMDDSENPQKGDA